MTQTGQILEIRLLQVCIDAVINKDADHLVIIRQLFGDNSNSGQVWYLIVSIPDLCTLTYFKILVWGGTYISSDIRSPKLVLRRRVSGAVKRDARTYTPNENFVYGNPH